MNCRLPATIATLNRATTTFLTLLTAVFIASAQSPSAETNPPPLPQSPVAQFRDWLKLDEANRAAVLSDKPEPVRRILLAKLAEYDAMDLGQREVRLRATELQYYVRPMLQFSPSERLRRLEQVPEEYRPLVEERLAQWDALDAGTRAELLTNAWAIRYFVRLETSADAEQAAFGHELSPQRRTQFETELTRWKALSPAQRRDISCAFHQFFELPAAKQHRALDSLPESERLQIEATLQAFAQLAPSQRQACLDSFRRFTGLTPDQRTDFLRSAERWKDMSSDDRATWRRLVTQLPPLPPLPPSRASPLPPLPRVNPAPPMPGNMPEQRP
ncbi:MAG: DUF3106 domain-containing protein [Verrucomicrobia bacterium]|nr:DUF3106 domain-containing protein [Verrucomicrobiota bacterium]